MLVTSNIASHKIYLSCCFCFNNKSVLIGLFDKLGKTCLTLPKVGFCNNWPVRSLYNSRYSFSYENKLVILYAFVPRKYTGDSL